MLVIWYAIHALVNNILSFNVNFLFSTWSVCMSIARQCSLLLMAGIDKKHISYHSVVMFTASL
ncbi:hypothetical protein C9J12_04230 [Photobacterium frigidiphilum]|uniref:Uncharacterized protein n=1 Tax=Photobacterium frigidiphilum TaxID=264736 RepID=A0A2T3JNB1_9GAMM|nr:hypothetical protein C9J12_04230 [Photobacterium frigidiphilum]